MRTIRIVCALCVSFILFACSKDDISSEIFYKAAFKAQLDSESDFAPSSKVSVAANGAVSWQNGDGILVAWVRSGVNVNAKFTNEGGNVFSGMISEADFEKISKKGNHLYFCYPYGSSENRRVKDWPTNGKNSNFLIDANQTGLLTDLGNYAMFLGKHSADSLALNEGQISFLNKVSLKCITPVVKFNVPASLEVKNIEISAKLEGEEKNITKKFIIRSADCEKGVGTSSPTDVDSDGTSIITISRGDDEISGDIYVALAPNYYNNIKWNFDAQLKIDELDFKLTNMSGDTKTLKLSVGYLYGGKITNLPAFPDSWSYSSPK